MHEHIFVLSSEIEKTAEEWDEEAEQTRALAKLRELKEQGIDTLVDLTVVGLGRSIPRIATIAAQVPEINIVVATGVYTYNEVPMYFHFQGPGTVLGGPEPMVDMFIREIRDGVADTGVRAAILKCATDRPGITQGVERVLRAVAQAHRRPYHHSHAATARTVGVASTARLPGGGRRSLARRHRPQRGHPQHRLSLGAH
jgi:phosphotriesterase-related protein